MPRLLQRLLTAVVTLALTFSSPIVFADAMQASPTTVASDKAIVVLFREELTPLQLAAFEDTYHVKTERPISDPQLLTFMTANADTAIAGMRNDPEVQVANLRTIVQAQTSDPLYTHQWWLHNIGQNFFIGTARLIITASGINQLINLFPAVAGNDIHWEEAMSLPACGGVHCTGNGVTVAVADSGIDATHPDLAGQISPLSKNIANPLDPTFDDTDGHGTFIAGLIAARADNGIGMAGAAPDAKVMALETSVNGGSSSDDVARAMRYAAQNGAAVINLSLAGPQVDDVLRQTIDEVTAQPYNMIVVAAAGNYANNGNPVLYPASFDHVISVASVNSDGTHTFFSEHNPYVDVSAPGGLVTSLKAIHGLLDCNNAGTPYQDSDLQLFYEGATDCIFTAGPASNGYYTTESGTSFSAPLVAGAAVLAKQKWPAITSDQFEQLVRATADDDAPGNGFDEYYGAGTLDLARLLSHNFPPQIAPGQVSFTAPAVTNDGSGTTTIVAKVDDLDGPNDISDVTADLSSIGLTTSATMNANGATFTSSPQIIPTSVTPGQYTVNVTAHDKAGQTATASARLNVVAAGTPISTPPPVVGIGTPSADVALSITRPSKRKEMTTRKKTITVSGTAGAGAAFVEVNGESASLDSTRGTWSARVQLARGENTIDIKSYDVTRTKSDAASLTVTFDTTPPGNVSDLTATAGGGSTHLSWKAPRDRDVAGFHIYDVSGSVPREVTTSPTTSATVSSAGSFAVTAEDAAGNESNLDSAPRTSTVVFNDVPKDHFAAAAIADLAARGIVQESGGLFRPNDPVTRAEFAKMLTGVRNEKASTSPSRFADVPTGDSFAGFISTVARLGWATGQGHHFYPSRTVTRFEAAAMIVRAASLALANSTPFSDVTDPSEKAVIGTLVTQGIASGQNGSFFPHRSLTRGEAAKMLEKVAL